jgi:hypothetical protein
MTPTLEQIREGQVPAELAGTYRDIRLELRQTYVPLLFRALAPHRGALKAAWHLLRPNVSLLAFEEASDWLRARIATASVELGTPLIDPVLASVGFDGDETDEVREQVDLFHYADPKVLLCLGMLDAAVSGAELGGHRVRHEMMRPLPPGPPPNLPELVLLPEEPGGVAGELLHEIRATLGLPVAEIDLRALGHWPEFLGAAWREVGVPLFHHRHIEQTMEGLLADVRHAVASLPVRLEPAAEAFVQIPQALMATERVLRTLRLPVTRLALFSAAVKVSLDGAQEALDSPFPVEWDEEPIDEVELPTEM